MKAITLLVLSLILISAPIVRADGTQTTISYTGTPFTDGTLLGTEMTGALTIDGTLSANAVNLSIIPTDFSFSDGFFTWDSQNVDMPGSFEVTTDQNGNITGWNVFLEAETFPAPGFVNAFHFLSSSWSNGVGQDNTRLEEVFVGGHPFLEDHETSTLVGAWTVTETTVTPEPSSLLLLSTGLLGWYGATRRMRRA